MKNQTFETAGIPAATTLARVRGELSVARRWGYRLLLFVASVAVAALISLWVTEPGPLPMRLHLAFAAMTGIGLGWVAVTGWILIRRRCPTAIDRIALGWMAVLACSISLLLSVGIALFRGQHLAAITLAAMGISLEAVALVFLRKAYAFRNDLRRRLAELEEQGEI